MAEVPLYKDKKYVELVEKVIGRIKEGFDSGITGKIRGKLKSIDTTTFNRSINGLLAQPNMAFLEILEKYQDANVVQLAHQITQKEDGLLRKFQAVLGMEAHHILPQNVMGWLRELPVGRALEALHEYRKQGGTTGVVPENIKSGSQMGHRAWKAMGLLKDAAGDAVKGVKNFVSAHVNPFTLLDDPKFFQGGFDRKIGNIFKQNQLFTPDDPIQFIVDTIKDQAGDPGKLFAKALDSPFEGKVQEYFSDLLGTDIFKLAESGADPGLVAKYNKALKTLKLNYNDIFKALAEGKKPPAWNDDILDIIDNFNDSVKSGKAWSENVLLNKLNKIKPDKWYRNPIVGRTPAGRLIRGSIPVLGFGADVAHAAGTTKEAFEDPNITNIVRAGSSMFNIVEQTGLFDMAVQYATDPKRAEEKGRENLTYALMKGSMLTSIPSDDNLGAHLAELERNKLGPGGIVKYEKIEKDEDKDEDKDKDDKPEYGYASTIRLSGV